MSVKHKKLNNDTADRDTLEVKLEAAEKIETINPGVDHDTRKGCYIRTRSGLSSAIFFIGIGRNRTTDPWRQTVERVG